MSAIGAELDLFRATRGRTLSLIAGLSQEELDFRPAAGRWSVGEVVDHMMRAEAFNRNDIERLIGLARQGREPVVRQTLEVVNISIFNIPKPLFALFEAPLNFVGMFLPSWVRSRATLTRLVPLQNPDNVTPRPFRPGDELRRELASSLAETEALLSENADLDFTRMIFVQPLLGEMNVPDLVEWMALHERRHQFQLCEVLTSENFPAAL